jgi:hypothetical protein
VKALRRASLRERVLHQLAERLPEGIADLGVNPGVAHDRERPLVHRDVEQDPVALFGLVHAETMEPPARRSQRASRRAALDVHADLAGGPPLRRPNGGRHLGLARFGQQPPHRRPPPRHRITKIPRRRRL